jgi:glycosyltransferase involved in cell wall biosynthesis
MLNTSRPDLAGRLRIRFVGPVSTDAALIQQVHAQAARNTCIITVPRCSRHEAIALQHDSDAVLHLTYRGRRGYLPVKFLEYLGAGRPLIMISAEQEEAEAMLRESGTGVQVRDAQELVRLLIARLEHHAQGNTWELPVDPSVLRNFSYPVRMEVWVKELEKRMEGRRAGSRA